ncbi:TRAP transporter small permease [Alkalicoccobacillus porphyridii]|uniref:TRAP transporter small permease n=1 Tax=Alkalicoccobacillus porphyridii TaxID=2597270 RepID=A0A554A2T9_9BACI|nr:TRAP transporter small permease [Alkalicoccobacillus porphyridii]
MSRMAKVDRLLGFISMCLFIGLLTVVIIQILSRYFPFDLIWTEELSRYLFVYSMVTAAPIALRKQEFIRVDMLILALPEKTRRVYECVIAGLAFIFSLVLVIYGLHFLQLGADFYAPTLGFSMAYAYAAVPLLGVLLMVYSIVYMFDRFSPTEEVEKGDNLL